MNAYITSDHVNIQTGGGLVTGQEYEALQQVGAVALFDGTRMQRPSSVWDHDDYLSRVVETGDYDVVHFYAGTFSKTVQTVRLRGVRAVTYTAAAHCVEESRREHESFGIPYDYPHLTEPVLWQRYLQGYLSADVLVVPSLHSRDVMRRYGRTGRIETLPHGVHLPQSTQLLPEAFTVGYLGAVGPDKGLIYLLKAWKQLNYGDSLLVIGGRDSQSQFVNSLIEHTGCRNVVQTGWVDNVSDFYNRCSLYVQPSVSEGFGCEVLEAMAHARPVLCSEGAGASDCVPSGWTFPIRDGKEWAEKIECAKSIIRKGVSPGFLDQWRNRAGQYTWDKIRERYIQLWKEYL